MWEMKSDMSGAASIMGAVLSLAKSKASVNVIGVAALAENMPGGNAQRPGDVVRTMSGKTIEILNTDAEGRLVMADANEYVIAQKKPAALVNMATLTGAIPAIQQGLRFGQGGEQIGHPALGAHVKETMQLGAKLVKPVCVELLHRLILLSAKSLTG